MINDINRSLRNLSWMRTAKYWQCLDGVGFELNDFVCVCGCLMRFERNGKWLTISSVSGWIIGWRFWISSIRTTRRLHGAWRARGWSRTRLTIIHVVWNVHKCTFKRKYFQPEASSESETVKPTILTRSGWAGIGQSPRVPVGTAARASSRPLRRWVVHVYK